jgi:hypothetical protein
MKRKSASNYDKQVILENTIGILFCVALTVLFLVNKETIIEIAKNLALNP